MPHPIDLEALVQLLRTASTAAQVAERKPAEQRLGELCSQPGTITRLLEVASLPSVDANIRVVASIMFKNELSRFWPRRFEDKPFRKEEKAALRKRLLEVFPSEANDRVFEIFSVIICKIARVDWPQHWPELFPFILRLCEISQPLSFRSRALRILTDVLTELSSKRLLSSRQSLQVGAHSMLSIVCGFWHAHVSSMASHPELALQCTRALKLVIVSADIEKAEEAKPLFTEMHSLFPAILNNSTTSIELAIELFELIRDILRKQPLSFRFYIRPFLDIFLQVLSSVPSPASDASDALQRLTISILSSLSLTCNSVRGKAVASGMSFSALQGLRSDPNAAKQMKEIVDGFLGGSTLQSLVSFILNRLGIMSSVDLRQWSEDPEAFFLQEHLMLESDQPELYTIRQCAISLLASLTRLYPDRVALIVTPLLKEAASIPVDSPEEMLLLRDSVYACAAVMLANGDGQAFSFSDWWSSSLHRDVQSSSRIQRRRVLQIITLLHSEIEHRQLLPAVIHLVKDSDFVIQLDAIVCLQKLCDTVHPQLPLVDLVPVILGAQSRCCELNSHVLLLKSLSTLVSVCDDIQCCLPHVVEVLPRLWQDCQHMNVVRSHLLSLLSSLATRLQHRCLQLSPLVLHLLLYTTDPSNRSHTDYMEEQTAELWLSWIRSVPSLSEECLSLFERYFALVSADAQSGCSLSSQYLQLLESYILLGAEPFLNRYHQPISHTLSHLLPLLPDRCALQLGSLLQVLATVAPSTAVTKLAPLLAAVLSSTLSSPPPHPPAVLASFCCVFGRLLLVEQEVTIAFLGQISVQSGSNTIGELLNLWLNNFDSISSIYSRKLSVLSLSGLLSASNSSALEWLNLILSYSSGVLQELESSQEESHYNAADAAYISTPPISDAPDRSQWSEQQRREQMVRQDPVNNCASVRAVLQQALAQASEQHPQGRQHFESLCASLVDNLILRSIFQSQ